MNFLGYFIYWAPPLRDFGIFLSGFFFGNFSGFSNSDPDSRDFSGFSYREPGHRGNRDFGIFVILRSGNSRDFRSSTKLKIPIP